ncbi:hypothetical protein BDN70DRAFT_106138 [Pholiota conissans]|uniref:Uncharacterized protein n=1 Tax=Pholiota conissans TaxID=109636 RepID=A0A9P5ZCV8_9AGAR|nr:hypothetical protein BDN70DRAFT_106138 [Pholiota conissans]
MSVAKDAPGELRLDPGPRPRRSSRLSWKCIALSFVGLGSVFGAFIVYNVIRAFMRQDVGVHTRMYQDLKVTYNASQVVRPLVDANQTFDIVATVWLRQDTLTLDEITSVSGGPILSEKAIYSETVFRGVRLEDQDLKTAVDLRVPTEIFKNPEIWTYDLRASFVLIPNSPSPLDYAVNYSSWIPDGINYPPMRAYPDGHSPSLADRIVDSYGAFLPLLSLEAINSSCPSSPDAKPKYSDDLNDETDEIYDLDTPIPPPGERLKRKSWHYMSTNRKSVLAAHPHIITRSQLRVVDVTKLFNRTQYENKHRQLRASACGQSLNEIYDWRFCWRLMDTHQNTETRIKLRKTDPLTGRNTTEWAYAPYLSLSTAAWGPLDIVKVPVNRENCQASTSGTNDTNSTMDEDAFVDVVWNIGFSGNTPNKIKMEDSMGLAAALDSKVETDEQKKKAQSSLDYIHGLSGHRKMEDAHPRRQMALAGIAVVLAIVGLVLQIHYWFTRASTVGISVFGTILVAGPNLLVVVIDILREMGTAKSLGVGSVIGMLLKQVPEFLPLFLMLKAVLRAELYWPSRWIPGCRLARQTHLERASQRLEARIPWLYPAIAYAALAFIATYYSDLRFLVSENKTPKNPTETFEKWNTVFHNVVVYPIVNLGNFLQVALNYRARTFAGMYRIAAPFLLIMNLASLGVGIPHVVGNLDGVEGVSIPSIINLMYDIALTWQALWYAPVVIQEEDEDEK